MKTTRKAIGIDFGGTAIKSAVVQDGELIAHGEVIDTQLHNGAESLIEAIVNVIATLRGEAQAETDGREGLRSLELLIGIYNSARDGKRVNLSPGMNITAEIKTGQRRVIEYLLSPVQRAGSESLRER